MKRMLDLGLEVGDTLFYPSEPHRSFALVRGDPCSESMCVLPIFSAGAGVRYVSAWAEVAHDAVVIKAVKPCT